MGAVATAKKLFHAVHIALRMMKHAARLMVRVNDHIQASPAKSEIKAASAAAATAAATFLTALEAYKATL